MVDFDTAELLVLEEQRRSASSRAKYARYLALLAPTAGEQILDLGSGGGAFARLLAPRVAPGGRVVGIDRSADAVALARRLASAEASGDVSFHLGDAHALPCGGSAFDAAACISLLAYCDDPGRVLAELRRVLRPRGRLLAANSDEDTRVYASRDRGLGRRVLRAMADRTRDPWLGRRLFHLLVRAGFRIVDEQVTTSVERQFAPGMAGFSIAHAWGDYLRTTADIPTGDYDRWLADLAACARDGAYAYSVTTYTYLVERD